MDRINFEYFVSLKGEFEAEGLTRDDLAAECLFAAKNNLDYLVKIGGCEAKADVSYLTSHGITSIVAPMIETPFAMEKYMEILPEGHFSHIGVTIETITAVENIEDILNRGGRLTEVTVGRTDLTASYKGSGVDSAKTIAMVKQVARHAKDRGLKVTMGGSISKETRALVIEDEELQNLLDYIETRKVVFSLDKFLDEKALTEALKLESFLLDRRICEAEKIMSSAIMRRNSIKSRL